MDIIDGEIIRTRSEWVALILKLLRRSLLTLSLAALVVAGAFLGYFSRPVIDVFIYNSMTLDQIAGLFRNHVTITYNASGIPVIYPDPAPIKLCIDPCSTRIDFNEKTDRIPRSNIPNLGQPKPVKTYRISPSGQILDGNPFPVSSETL